MVAKKGKKTAKKVNSLKAKNLNAKEAKGVKGGTFTYRPAGAANTWAGSAATNLGSVAANKISGNT